jgi:hypothetical protein
VQSVSNRTTNPLAQRYCSPASKQTQQQRSVLICHTAAAVAAAAAAAGDDGDDQPGFHRPFRLNLQLVLGAVGTFFIAALCDAGEQLLLVMA